MVVWQIRQSVSSLESLPGDIIADISDQVDLPALNATIEAARAGDAGKLSQLGNGFTKLIGTFKI